MSFVEQYLGLKIEEETFKRILMQLGCTVKKDNNKYTIQTAIFRNDLKEDVDLIEEFIRIIGYESISMKYPIIQNNRVKKIKIWDIREKINQLFLQQEYLEIKTYTVMSRKKIEDLFLK